MKKNKTLLGVAIISALTLTGAYSATASANSLILGWDLNTDNAVVVGGTTSATLPANSINNLGLNGESIVTISNTGPNYTFTDNGVFNFTQYNGGPTLLLGGGQLTAVLKNGTGNVLGTSGFFTSFVFTGGLVDFYYNNTQTFGSNGTNYGASDGTLIAEFTIQPGGGGITNTNGTPFNNGTVTISSLATAINNNGLPVTPAAVWTLSPSIDLNRLVGYITTNAREDLFYKNNAVSDFLTQTLTGSATPFQNTYGPGGSFLVNNGGQFALESVPEPTALTLLGLAMVGLGYSKKRRVS